jgi:hypothetical protein
LAYEGITNPETESMKKTATATKATKAKEPRQRRMRQPNPLLAVLQNMDEDTVAMLRQMMQDELGIGPDMSAPKDPVDLFARFLRLCGQSETDDDDMAALSQELTVELGDLRVSSNGGDREAREKMQAIYDLLDDAIENRSMGPIDLMMSGRILADAEWAVPDSLKQALIEATRSTPPGRQGDVVGELASTLLEVADQTDQNPFEVHGYMNSFMASFPPEANAMLLFELGGAKEAVIAQAIAGFVLHPDAVLAQSASEALAASAKQTPVESSLIERLIRMRPWLPQPRQAQLDAAIRAMRSNALPPVKSEPPKLIKCYLSICDGSGTRSFLATQRIGPRYQIATVMMKPAGVADAMILPALAKSNMDEIVRQMKSNVPLMEADLADVTRMLELAIAENVASAALPPFKLVEVVESLGLGPIHPNPASPLEIIESLLADLPPEQTSKAATSKAHGDVLLSEFKYQWFEAGEELEDLLYPVKGLKQRIAKLMTAYLPQRRPFWARQCAISALAMRGDQKARLLPWKQLALVGRDIDSNVPMDQIPLMKQVAESSVRAFERRR